MTPQQNQSDESELEALFISFAQVILDQVVKWTNSEGVSQSFHRHIDFTKNGPRPRFEMKRDYNKLLLVHFDDPLWKSETVERCVRQHRLAWSVFPLEAGEENFPFDPFEKEEGEFPFNPFDIDGVVLQGLWQPIVDVLERYGTLQPTQQQLIESYTRYRYIFGAKNWQWNVTIPLLGFDSDIKRNEPIGGLLQLAPFTPEEKAFLWNQDTDLEMKISLFPKIEEVNLDKFSSTLFQLSGTFTVAGRNIYNQQNLFEDVENILTALRLNKAGNVGILAFFSQIQTPDHSRQPLFHQLPDQRLRQRGSPYQLVETDLLPVKTLYSSLQHLSKQKSSLAVAMRRFNGAYSRDLLEDQIIDFTIALDSSLLAGSKADKFRLSSRGAALLADGEPRWEKSMTKLFLEKMYSIRNKIVHEGKRLVELQDDIKKIPQFGKHPAHFPKYCEDIVRVILRTYVLRQQQGLSVDANGS